MFPRVRRVHHYTDLPRPHAGRKAVGALVSAIAFAVTCLEKYLVGQPIGVRSEIPVEAKGFQKK